jgi:hypothetical protein
VVALRKDIKHILRKLDGCIATVSEYNIGMTGNPNEREKAQRGVGFDDIVVLSTGLSHAETLALEKALFHAIKESDKRSSRSIKAQEKITGPDSTYKNSSGGKPDTGLNNYAVYVSRCFPT